MKVTKAREFLEDLDRFRVYASSYVGNSAEELYRDVREVIEGIEVIRGEV